MAVAVNEKSELTCKKCNQNFEVEASDLKREGKDHGVDPMTFTSKCPHCGRINYVGYKQLTEDTLFSYYNTVKNPWDNDRR